MRVRAFTTNAKHPELVQAVETPQGIVFIDTLGKRWAAAEIVSFRPIVDTAGNLL